MTNNKPRCIDCNVQLNARNRGNEDLCINCYDLAGLENNHQDGYHEDDVDGPHKDCLMCNSEARADRSRKGSERVSKGRIDHRPCYAAGTHEKSYKGREACRKTHA